ncbi:hypothetical protein OVA29_11165 [Exiguobacterium sp. SL14]|nr:hypothetical protein [Exiguobacterium sp. SL14]MCY1691172.1 hypothetical protein [Exiguobacterium sp. SL14]
MRKDYVFVISLSLVALFVGLQLGFSRLPEQKPKQVATTPMRPADYKTGLASAKRELKQIQRFTLKSTLPANGTTVTWIYETPSDERIAVDWYYVESYPEAQVQMTRNETSRIISYERYLIVIRPIYGTVVDSELEQFALRFTYYFTTQQQGENDVR